MEIKLDNICCSDRLHNINYVFRSGKVTSIIGNSGSGKSLIGSAIMGLVDIDMGYIIVDGNRKYDRYNFSKKVGYVYQNPWDHFFCETVFDEIAFGLKQFRYKLNNINKRVIDSLKMVGLSDKYLDRKISTLSSGEAERVAIASSLILNPDVLILDEPTIYLDDKVKKDIFSLIKLLRDRYKKSVIVISNDMDFVMSVSDFYLNIDNGCVKSSGDIKGLVNEEFDNLTNIYKFIRLARDKYKVNLKYTSNINNLVTDVVNNV